MEKQTLKLIALFVRIDNTCKKKMTAMSRRRGRPSKPFSQRNYNDLRMFYALKSAQFQSFLEGIHGIFLRSFFPKMPSYTAFFEAI
jgi:hypothetical protein